jgi:hypothetical protein
MKTIITSALALSITAMLLTTATAGPAAAKKEVPFKGVIEGTEDFTFQDRDENGVDLLINGDGGGNATHLGRFTATWDGFIDTTGEVDNLLVRTFVAANGDELYAEGPGAGTPPPDQFVTEHMVIMGGTGRFEEATGSFTVERWVFDVGNPGITDLVTVGSFDGTITFAD